MFDDITNGVQPAFSCVCDTSVVCGNICIERVTFMYSFLFTSFQFSSFLILFLFVSHTFLSNFVFDCRLYIHIHRHTDTHHHRYFNRMLVLSVVSNYNLSQIYFISVVWKIE